MSGLQMVKNAFRFSALVFTNYLVIYFSPEIDLEQLTMDFEIVNLFLSEKSLSLRLFISISITSLTLILIYVFRPFIEIYLLYYLKYSFYFFINLLSLSTVFIIFRVYGYSRLVLILYLVLSSLLLIVSDKIKS